MPATRPGALRRAVPLALSAAIVAATLSAAPAQAADRAGRRTVVDRPAFSASAVRGSALDGDEQVQVEVVFDLADAAGAEALATAVSTPGSPQYRQYLAPSDWIARFSPAQADVDAFVAAAQSYGVRVDTVPESRLFVLLDGTVDDFEGLFATDLKSYSVHGTAEIAAASDVSLPRRAAAAVGTVAFDRPVVRPAAVVPAKRSTAAAACSAYWGQHRAKTPKTYGARSVPTALCGYTPKQVRALYGLGATSNGLDGRGQTVAVIDAFGAPTMRADLATYSARNGLPAASYTEVVDRSGWTSSEGCTPDGWQSEQALDLEAVHAVAPRAALVYVGASDCAFGMDVAMSTVLDRRLATIVSNSWGSPGGDTFADGLGIAATVALNVNQHLQAAGEGIGLYFASGDAGDDSAYYGQTAVDFPASSPWVTAVGGTSSALDRKNRLVFSTAWGDSVVVARKGASSWSAKLPGTFYAGAGGGASSLFAAPAYQSAVPASVSRGRRTSADVAALASPFTGFAVGYRTNGKYTTETAGGTSLATPIVAAQVALAQQLSGRQLGFLNPALYRAGAAKALRDVAPSSGTRAAAVGLKQGLALVTFDHDTSLRARRGYDVPTGLGELTRSSLGVLGRY